LLDSNDRSPLSRAVSEGHLDVVKTLVERLLRARLGVILIAIALKTVLMMKAAKMRALKARRMKMISSKKIL